MQTPHQRVIAREKVPARPKIAMNAKFKRPKPATLVRQILAVTSGLEVLGQAKKYPTRN
ncbi:hypothetical protein [Devriesea agamarum]|uniref:hypothetical protein n=1 Tax=Devriesea agamarum TaxID=472569 RepID=UPI0012EDA17C|nr:hypothetical protein [Devriesea agamarum]